VYNPAGASPERDRPPLNKSLSNKSKFLLPGFRSATTGLKLFALGTPLAIASSIDLYKTPDFKPDSANLSKNSFYKLVLQSE